MKKLQKKIDYEFVFFIAFTAIVFIILTGATAMGFFANLIFIFVITIYLYICRVVSLILFRVLRKFGNSYVLPILQNVKHVKQQIELDDDVVYDKSKSKQKHIERDKG